MQQLLKPVHATVYAPQQEKPPQREAHAKTRAEPTQQQRPNTARNKEINNLEKNKYHATLNYSLF